MDASIQLRDYQQHAIDAVCQVFDSGQRRTLLSIPTGGGKTIIFGMLAREVVEQGGLVLVLADTEELVDQTARTLRLLLPTEPGAIPRASCR